MITRHQDDSVGLTLFGLFLVSFLIGLGTDVVHELLELSRLRPAGLRASDLRRVPACAPARGSGECRRARSRP